MAGALSANGHEREFGGRPRLKRRDALNYIGKQRKGDAQKDYHYAG